MNISIPDEFFDTIKAQLRNVLKEEIKKEVMDELNTKPESLKGLPLNERQKIYNKRWFEKKGRQYFREYMRRPEQKEKQKTRYEQKKALTKKDDKYIDIENQLIVN